MLRELNKLRIRTKLLVIMLLIGLVPVLALGMFTYMTSQPSGSELMPAVLSSWTW